MSTPYFQQPAGQPAPQGVPQMGMPAQPAPQVVRLFRVECG